MGLQDLINKYEKGKLDKTGWFRLKSDCEGCIFNLEGNDKHCLIYIEEGGKEKPSSGCRHRKTPKEAVEIAQSGKAD